MYIYGDDWGSTSCLVFQVTPPPLSIGGSVGRVLERIRKKISQWKSDTWMASYLRSWTPRIQWWTSTTFGFRKGRRRWLATRRGLALKRYGGGQIKTSLELVEEAVQDLESTQPSSETHQNQMGMLICPECSPCTYKKWTSQETCANRCISVVFYRTFILIKFTRWWL